jgi:hypothetical protein
MERQPIERRPGFFGRLLSLAERIVRPFGRLACRCLGPNGDLKVLAVVAAAVIYGLVARQIPADRKIERSFPVQVKVISQTDSSAVLGVRPAFVDVTLRGAEKDLAAFSPDALFVELRASPRKDVLSEELSVRGKYVRNVPAPFRIRAVAPAKVTVEYDPMSASRATDVIARPQLLGLDKLRGTARISDDSLAEIAGCVVTIYGSMKRLNAFSEKRIRLPTDPIDVEGKTADFEAVVAIRPPEDLGITKVEPDRIRVRVEIELEKDPDADSIRVSDPIPLAPAEPDAPKAPEESAAKRTEAEEAATNGVPPAEPAPAEEEIECPPTTTIPTSPAET